MQETIFYLKENKSIIVTDLIQRHNTNLDNYGKFSSLLLKLDGISGKNGGCPFDYRSTFYWPFGKWNVAKKCFSEVINWEFEKIFIAHGDCVLENGKEYVKKSLSFLL